MDIHKPKPWHGVREFLKEYVIIVVGVLTALGAEQGVEWLHWRYEVRLAQETLKPEYLRLMETVGRRDGESPCIAERVDALDAILDRAGETGRLPPLGLIGQPTRDPWNVRGWEALVAGQVLQHMPHDQARGASDIAIRAEYVSRERDVEVERWATLVTLMGPGRKLEPGELAAYRVSLGMVARQAGVMRASVDGLPKEILKTGVVTRAEAETAWRKGVAEGRLWMLCDPLSASPLKLSAAQGRLAVAPSLQF